MIVSVLTESRNKAWLSYLLEEFVGTENANFTFRVVDSLTGSEEHVLRYVKSPESDVFQSDHNQITWANNKKHITVNGIWLLEGSWDENEQFQLNFDLFWNAFYLLGRCDEFVVSQSKDEIHSYSNRTNAPTDFPWHLPHVNIYFKELKKFLAAWNSDCVFEMEQEAKLELSHDLDYVRKTTSLRLKQSAFNLYNAFTKRKVSKLKKSFQFLFGTGKYWCFDYWMEVEKKKGMVSTFYVYSKQSKSAKKWLLDPSYNVSKDVKLQNQLKSMLEQGWKIGLHGSFYSADDLELITKEKESLELAVGQKVTATRQHWLRYFEHQTPLIHEQLFQTDSTVGWNDRIGFRAGIASKYKPYNHKEGRAFDYFVIPQVVMDSNIFDYGFGREEEITDLAISLLDQCKKLGNTHVAISWHPRTCAKDYNWHLAYERILESW